MNKRTNLKYQERGELAAPKTFIFISLEIVSRFQKMFQKWSRTAKNWVYRVIFAAPKAPKKFNPFFTVRETRTEKFYICPTYSVFSPLPNRE